MGDGVMGGIASKNLFPPLRPKIRDLKKNLTKKGGNHYFLKISFFVVFLRTIWPFFKKISVFKNQFSSTKIWFVNPLPLF